MVQSAASAVSGMGPGWTFGVLAWSACTRAVGCPGLLIAIAGEPSCPEHPQNATTAEKQHTIADPDVRRIQPLLVFDELQTARAQDNITPVHFAERVKWPEHGVHR